MKLSYLTFLQFMLISVVDEDQHQGVTFDAVLAALENGDIVLWLEEKYPTIDLSIYTREEAKELTVAMENIAIAVNPRRKFGVEHNGICWLLAILTEMIQHREWLPKA